MTTRFPLPSLELLEAASVPPATVHEAMARLIEQTFDTYGVPVRVQQVHQGPRVSQFALVPGSKGATRVRVRQITALQKDLALVLAVPSLRMEAPVPSRPYIGLEVPTQQTVVHLRTMLTSAAYARLRQTSALALPLGLDVAGIPIVADLQTLPHLLIAGATGSGKSVFLSSIITSLLVESTPDEVRLILIDPKRVELTPFEGVPHLQVPHVITDAASALEALSMASVEMDARYRQLEALGVRNIQAYNADPRAHEHLPFWVIIIDELADLMLAAPKEAEARICRLAQMARAVGIHLIVATQRPSVDVITGLIKANFPARVAFAVVSWVDSRVILDSMGAEALLGQGDMLFSASDSPRPQRIQAAYVSDQEIENVVRFWHPV